MNESSALFPGLKNYKNSLKTRIICSGDRQLGKTFRFIMNPSENGVLFFFGFLNTRLQVMGWDGSLSHGPVLGPVGSLCLPVMSQWDSPTFCVSFLSLLLFWGSRVHPETSSRYKVDSNNSYCVGLSTGLGIAVAWVSLNKASWGCIDGRILSLLEAGRQMLSLRRWGGRVLTWWPATETLSLQRNPSISCCNKINFLGLPSRIWPS